MFLQHLALFFAVYYCLGFLIQKSRANCNCAVELVTGVTSQIDDKLRSAGIASPSVDMMSDMMPLISEMTSADALETVNDLSDADEQGLTQLYEEAAKPGLELLDAILANEVGKDLVTETFGTFDKMMKRMMDFDDEILDAVALATTAQTYVFDQADWNNLGSAANQAEYMYQAIDAVFFNNMNGVVSPSKIQTLATDLLATSNILFDTIDDRISTTAGQEFLVEVSTAAADIFADVDTSSYRRRKRDTAIDFSSMTAQEVADYIIMPYVDNQTNALAIAGFLLPFLQYDYEAKFQEIGNAWTTFGESAVIDALNSYFEVTDPMAIFSGSWFSDMLDKLLDVANSAEFATALDVTFELVYELWALQNEADYRAVFEIVLSDATLEQSQSFDGDKWFEIETMFQSYKDIFENMENRRKRDLSSFSLTRYFGNDVVSVRHRVRRDNHECACRSIYAASSGEDYSKKLVFVASCFAAILFH